jgi:uncharacterized protein (DUF2249 family)
MKKIYSAILFLCAMYLKAQIPSLTWAKSFGKYLNQGPYYTAVQGFGITTDASGNVITTGGFRDTVDFDPGPGSFTLTAITGTSGSSDIFISKLDASGNFIWALSFGNPNMQDYGFSVITDASGSIYATGNFRGIVDFDPGPGTYTLDGGANSYNSDAFLLKISPTGTLVWAKSISVDPLSQGIDIKLDAAGNIYWSGNFGNSGDFDPGPGTYSLTSNGGIDSFVLKLDQNGNFLWAKNIGGSSNDGGTSAYCCLDGSGNVYIAGTFSLTADLDPGLSNYTVTSAGDLDIFIVKLDAAGNFVWGRTTGGAGFEIVRSIELDQAGNLFYAGEFAATSDFDPGPGTYTLTPTGGNDDYVVKLNSSGNFVWAKSIGGTGAEESWRLVLDAAGNAYYTGAFQNIVDFDPGPGSYSLTAYGWDMFMSKLDNSGNFVWAVRAGQPSPQNCTDAGYGISVDASGNIYGTGEFSCLVDFDPGPGTYTIATSPSLNGNVNCFVSKLGPAGGVGITENSPDNFIKIYPNPNNGEFIVGIAAPAGNTELKLCNSLGQIVYTRILSPGENKIKTGELGKGLYYYYSISGNGQQTNFGKLIIE